MKSWLSFFAAAFLAASCASAPSAPSFADLSLPELPSISTPDSLSQVAFPFHPHEAPEIETDLDEVIYWRVIEDDIIIVHAPTKGCTVKSDFLVNVEEYSADIYLIRLERVRDDLCSRDMPWGVEIAYGFEELGVPSGARIVILNPLTDEPWDWG